MKNIPEINHCIPNHKALWCSACRAHNQWDYSSSQQRSSSGTTTTEYYRCRGCRALMFCPGQTLPWMYVLCGKALVMIPYGFIAGMDSQYNLGPFCVAWGGFCALLGGWMLFDCKKWFAWTNRQRWKNPTGLEQEARNHAFQPSYEKSKEFDGWAGQFLSDEEVKQLHEKYGSGSKG